MQHADSDQPSNRPLYLLVFAAATILFALQILIPKVLLFLHVVDNLLRILPITFLGLALGSGIVLLAPSRKLFLLLFALVAPALLAIGVCITLTADAAVLTVALDARLLGLA